MKENQKRKKIPYGIIPAAFLELGAIGILLLLGLLALVVFPAINWIASLLR